MERKRNPGFITVVGIALMLLSAAVLFIGILLKHNIDEPHPLAIGLLVSGVFLFALDYVLAHI